MARRYQFHMGTILVVTATAAVVCPLVAGALGNSRAAETLAATTNGLFVLACLSACVQVMRFVNEK